MAETSDDDVFISYVGSDRAWVEGFLLDALNKAEVKYILEEAFRPGVPRIQEFQRAIQQSRRTLLVISQAYLADDFSEFVELLSQSYGQDTQTWPVIPLLLEAVQLPPRLAMLVGLNATTTSEQEAAVKRLCADLQHPIPPESPKPACPYPGMAPFDAEHSEYFQYFFGRDDEIQELLERLRLETFMVAIGPSGSGKSSLIFAGLIPALNRSDLFGTGKWLVRHMRPGKTPLTALKELLGGNLDNPTRTVAQALSAEPETKRLLVVIDQFEELFTQPGEEAAQFQQVLQQFIGCPNCYIVLTVRADFYSDLMTSPLWSKVQAHRIEVVPLNEAGLRAAIERPAESVGVFIEPTLLDRLIGDAAEEPGVLPLVQETMVLLWQHIERRFLPLRAYQALVLTLSAYRGSTKEHQTGLQVAIARRADAAYAALENELKQAIARRIFLRLIQFGEGRADTRRQQLVKDLQSAYDDPVIFQQTLNLLIDSRLLTANKNEEDPKLKKVDIAHEALISGWPKLQKWIDERRSAEQRRRNLADKAAEWNRLGKGSGGLLDDIELIEAERWLGSVDAKELGYDQLIEDFVKASKATINSAKQKRQLVYALLSVFGIAILATTGLVWSIQRDNRNMQTVLDVQLGNFKPDTIEILLPILDKFLNDAKQAKDNADKAETAKQSTVAFEYQGQAINSSRAVLDIIFRIETSNYKIKLDRPAQERIDNIKNNASVIMEDQILKYGLKKINDRLAAKQIGKLNFDTTYLDYEKKFTEGALKATYEVIMIDLGADINRVGTLTPKETERIPCKLLVEIDNLWRTNHNENCGWYGQADRLTGGRCISVDYPHTLTSLIFPQISYGYIEKRLDTCNVKYTPIR